VAITNQVTIRGREHRMKAFPRFSAAAAPVWVQPPATRAAVAFLARPRRKTHVTFVIVQGRNLVGVVSALALARQRNRAGKFDEAPPPRGQHQPGNTRSISLVRQLGFDRRGFFAPVSQDRRSMARPQALDSGGQPDMTHDAGRG
jgi:hypothetical protein